MKRKTNFFFDSIATGSRESVSQSVGRSAELANVIDHVSEYETMYRIVCIALSSYNVNLLRL